MIGSTIELSGLVTHSTCKITSSGFFIFRCLKVIFSFMIKVSRLTAIETETAFFHSLGNPKGRMFDYVFCA